MDQPHHHISTGGLAECKFSRTAAEKKPTRPFTSPDKPPTNPKKPFSILLAILVLTIITNAQLSSDTNSGSIYIPTENESTTSQTTTTIPPVTPPTEQTITTITETTTSTSYTLPAETGQPSSSTASSEIILPFPESAELQFTQETINNVLSYSVDAPSFTAKLGEQLSEEGVELTSGSATLKFKPLHKKTGPAQMPILDKNKIIYKNMLSDGVDFDYEVQQDKLEEKIVIQDYKSIKDLIVDGELTIDYTLNNSENTFITLDGTNEWYQQPISTPGKIIIMLKRQPGIIYASDNAFTILEPYAIDANNETTSLYYTLTKTNNETTLTTHIPQQYLKKTQYPITIDPTIIVDSPKNMFLWQNIMHCGTNTNYCNSIALDPSTAWLRVNAYCYSQAQGVAKPMFRFNITCIPTSKVRSARVYYQGTCFNNGNMTLGDEISLWQISSFTGTPSCSNNYDANVLGKVTPLMRKSACFGGTRSVDITSNLTDAKRNGDPYLAFKIDIQPELDTTEQPGCTNCNYHFSVTKGGTQLYLTYTLNCLHTTECGGCSPEYCGTDGVCAAKKGSGEACTSGDIDGNRNNMCNPTRICIQDTYDNGGDWYCAFTGQCVYNGSTYNNGYRKCDTSNSYKECNNGIWSTSNQCAPGYGCDETKNGCYPLPNLRISEFSIREVTA